MKTMKALILALALGLTVAATAVGCNNNKNDSANSDNSGFLESVETLTSVSFDKSEVKLYQYENVTLGCSAKGTTEKIVYSSSDPSVASVDENEKITLYKETQQILTKDAASVYLQDGAKLVAVNKKFTNFLFYPVYVLDLAAIKPAQ